MGRHSRRRGPAPKSDPADIAAQRDGRQSEGAPGPQGASPRQGAVRPPQGAPPRQGMPAPGGPSVYGDPVYRQAPQGVRRFPDGTPAQGVPRFADGTPAQGMPRFGGGTPARGVPRLADGTPAHGVPRFADGTPAQGVPRFSDGTPAQGMPRFPDGTPAHGTPRFSDGTPAHGTPRVRGGHPEQREAGGAWGESGAHGMAGAPGVAIPRQRQAPPGGPRQTGAASPRQEYLDAFGDQDVFAPRSPQGPADPYASVTDWRTAPQPPTDGDDDEPPIGGPTQQKGGKGRAFTGIAAAAVTTVLAIVVAGQVADGRDDDAVRSQSATDQARDARDSASRSDGRPTPSSSPGVALTYEQKMGRRYALDAKLEGSGKFDAVKGIDKAPGTGQKFTYRVDVEQGLGLDGELFAEAVQKTLNDDRSWAHNGARTFERIYSGKPDFVITLASPGTTGEWCAKSGLDTTVDNVSCDSASTERVMINAYRWAQGSKTYGDQIHAYRQMLINHEVGHRLGYHHVTCDKNGELAPVMQQQTKFLNHDGITCKANPWAYPGS
ncbi:DUF3152 domain-containing protein [Streptomyces sp. NPDC088357]|uniref:DUF3152 domain-containing protein n=1 Tax=Streptomyces sp. NPDC088357 TaxID=3154655 RepID=UPI0034207BD4